MDWGSSHIPFDPLPSAQAPQPPLDTPSRQELTPWHPSTLEAQIQLPSLHLRGQVSIAASAPEMGQEATTDTWNLVLSLKHGISFLTPSNLSGLFRVCQSPRPAQIPAGLCQPGTKAHLLEVWKMRSWLWPPERGSESLCDGETEPPK